MVSRQEETFYSRKRDITIYGEDFHNNFKKSKHEDQSQGKLKSTLSNELRSPESMRKITFDIELHLRTPLSPDCHKSIEAKGYSRTSEDQRTYPKDPVSVRRPKMGLDLELNLSPSYSPSKTTTKIVESSHHNETASLKGENLTGLNPSPSWLAFEDDDVDHKEQQMITTVCMKCHMLVMLCTSTPVCPNCKFMHPHDLSSTELFEPSNLLRLLC